jgi:hypothetical protein
MIKIINMLFQNKKKQIPKRKSKKRKSKYPLILKNKYEKDYWFTNPHYWQIKGYDKLKKTYSDFEISKKRNHIIKGKRVKYWKVVSFDSKYSVEQEYIPIFFKRKRR